MANFWSQKSPNLEALVELARSNLSSALSALPGAKDLVLENNLIRPLDRVGGIKILKENGVGKIFKLDQDVPPIVEDRRVFVIRAEVARVRQVANCIKADVLSKKGCRFAVLMVPRTLFVCERILEEEGVYGYVTVKSLDLSLIPIDNDILSLEMPSFFKSYFLDSDYTGIHTVASSLVDLQMFFGVIPNVYGQGKGAQMAHNLMKMLMQEQNLPSSHRKEVGHLFLFDRDVDYATVLLSQLTYEGLLDEVFGIKSGYIDLGAQVTGSEKSVVLLLTSESQIFNEIRNNHVTSVFESLAKKSKELQTKYQNRQNMSIDEMRNFVANEFKDVQQEHQTLSLHVKACEVIKDKKSAGLKTQLAAEHGLLKAVDDHISINYIEEIIIRQYPVLQSLSLLCLLSLTHNGIPSKQYKALKTLFLHSYGFEHMISFMNLKKLGLFVIQEPFVTGQTSAGKLAGKVAAAAIASFPRATNSSFQAIAKRFHLFPKCDNGYSLKNPPDMGYVFSGAYIPLVCSYVQQVLLREGVSGLEESVKLLPGVNFTQISPKSARGRGGDGPPAHVDNSASRNVLVYFIGGVTYAEIAAFRYLSNTTAFKGYKFIIAATSIISGNTMLEGVVEEPFKLRENTPVE